MSDRDEDMPELSSDAAAAWKAFERSIGPDDGAQARVLQRVRARTKARRREDEIEDAPSEAQGGRRAAAAVLVMKSSAIAVGIAGTALLSIKLVVAAVRPPAAPPAPSVAVAPAVAHEEVDTAPPPRAQPTPAAIEPQPVPVQAPASPVISAKPKRAAAAPASVPTADRLKAETDLIERVRVAMRANEYARAGTLLEQHRVEFPNGTLVEERLAFAAIAACELGRADGSERARTFAKSHPRSPQLAAVRAACGATANDPMDPTERPQ